MGRRAEYGDHCRAQSINRVKEIFHMAKKTVKTVTPWYDAPLANCYVAWGVIAVAALAFVLAVAKPSCKCKHGCCGKPVPAAKAKATH